MDFKRSALKYAVPSCLIMALGVLCFGAPPARSAKQPNRPLLRPSLRPSLRPFNYRGLRSYPVLKWRTTIGMVADTAPAIADLDLDGTMDIVLPGVDGYLYRLTSAGEVAWKVDLPAPVTAGVTLGDADRDGALDILLATGKTLRCFDAAGAERWHFDVAEPIQSLPTIADIDGDNKPEILFGANDNKLHVLNGKGKEKWSFATKSWIVGGVAVSDLGNDKKLEIVFGSMDFNVYCLDSAGKFRWKHATGDWVQAAPVIADLDRDRGPDIVTASDDGHLYCLSRRGTLKWRRRFAEPQRMKPYLATADLDGDGTGEIVACSPDGNVRVFTAFGERAWSTNVGGAVLGSPVIADLNGDGWQDILVATTGGQLVALNTWGSMLWSSSLGQTAETTPLIADLNRNGKYEIYIANLMRTNRDAGFFSQFELSTTGGKALWTTLKGDPYRTGMAPNSTDYGANLRRGGDYATAWEPFGVGARPRTGVQAPRRLRVTALPLEDIKGNHDGALDPGETALFKVQVVNEGQGASYDSTLVVNLSGTLLKLDRNRSYLGWIAPKARKTAVFRLSAPPLVKMIEQMRRDDVFRDVAETPETPPSTVKPTRVRPVRRQPTRVQIATMQVLESGVQAAVAEARVMNVPPLPPLLRVHHTQVVDGISAFSFGNGNGILDSGESVMLRLLLKNDNLSTAKTATAILSSGSADVLVSTRLVNLKGVVPFGGRRVDFGLRVARQIKGKSVTLKLTTQSPAAPPHSELITLPLRQGPVDATAPRVDFLSPPQRIATTTRASMTLAGVLSDASGLASFRFEQKPVPVANLKRLGPNRYRFAFFRALQVGENVFPLSVADKAGNSSTLWVRVVRKPMAQAVGKTTPKPGRKVVR
ncbi:MAG TPA: FG-GAP-like repeat-containing protein [Abditibacteriaceae bacterium]|nr:FG-GAP-like repeat-containing protein [Abditibacteriaceae bacterium]